MGLLAALLALLLTLTACSASGQTDSAPDAAAPADPAVREAGGSAEDPAGAASTGEGATVQGDESSPLMVRTAQVEVLVEDVGAAVSRARAAATGTGGWVSSEEVVPRVEGRAGWATLVLRVPSEDLDAVLTQLGELGEVTGSSSQAEDVTVEYRDVEARVATLEAGAARLRELVAQASSVEDIASLERELSDREAELDALKARMQVLADDVSRSTVTVHLAEDSQSLGSSRSDTGFMAGLRQGWDAFTSSVTVLMTALGAFLPFLLLLALVLVPVLWWRRSRRPQPRIESRGDRHSDAAGDPDGS